MLKKDREEEVAPWDRKKIILGALVLVVAVVGLIKAWDMLAPSAEETVKGVQTENYIKQDENISKASSKIQGNIEEIKENVNNLSVTDVATSSPQVQKVLNDIKELQDYPKNQARDMCEKICSGF